MRQMWTMDRRIQRMFYLSENGSMNNSDEHYTPKWVFDKMGLDFDMDVASPGANLSHCPAKIHITKEMDGLLTNWQGLVWMNPPFSKPSPWVDKFIEHNNGIALLVVSKSKWFAKIWELADAVVPTPRDLKFHRPSEADKQISFQTFLFALGEKAVKGVQQLATARIR